MTRISLGGEGDPIPIFALPDLNLSDDLPVLSIALPTGVFLKEDYVGLGYTNYEVVCVGGGGGKGGLQIAIDGHVHYGWTAYSYGGAGGGGGMHQVSGLLADLPDSVPVVVGGVGADGVDATGQPPYPVPTSGGDGGPSSFGPSICQASGGKGGLVSPITDDNMYTYFPYTQKTHVAPGGKGGDGGIGGSVVAGGGAAGGDYIDEIWNGFPGSSDNRPFYEIANEQGSWDGAIGEGGGGGLGGTTIWGRVTTMGSV